VIEDRKVRGVGRSWREVLEQVWSAETSATPEWPKDCPSNGQCAVTALVIQDYEGGIIQRVRTLSSSHYYNRLADGTDLDLTRDQFGPYEVFGEPQERTREYILSFPETARRYELLLSRVREYIAASN
jgi:hypothetical protein